MRLPNGENASISRAGITLIEILISIMILGVGLVSLATLFPIGLLRLRDAQRQSRSAYLFESAAADLASRGLLSKATFINPAISPWYITAPSGSYDPWIQDTPAGLLDWAGGGNNPQGAGVYRGLGGTGSTQYNTQLSLNALLPIPGPGLPVAYDPLWRFFTYSPTSGRNGFASTQSPPATVRDGYFLGLEQSEARFGNGIGFVRPSGDPLDGNPPNAWGLQRLTNLNPLAPTTWTAGPGTFVSPEDAIWQDPTVAGYSVPFSLPLQPVTSPSPVLPDLNMSGGALTYDWRFTWMFTGRRSDAYNGTSFEGDVVVFENRPFSIDNGQVAGETVVEAVFGYSGAIVGQATGATVGYGTGSSTLVILLWPKTDQNGNPIPDPVVKAGSWIADVTYQRNYQLAVNRFANAPANAPESAQRCHWYQVSHASTPADATGTPYQFSTLPSPYRYIQVWLSNKLQDKTLLQLNANGAPEPYTTNAALVSPYVVNVIPRAFVTP